MNLPLHPFFCPSSNWLSSWGLDIAYCTLIKAKLDMQSNWPLAHRSLWDFIIICFNSRTMGISKTESKDYSQEIIQILEKHQLMGNIVTWGTIIFFVIWLNMYSKKWMTIE
ncbi:MAG: hypothetical protein Ct9H90mP20_5070 [Candidatus Neomarinimicrobiota bacterium]|nr:MAG: hypothetical protein Ct9H90mP20_5070 [Candidatus Neomarinimicrobiota bacterium]